MRRIYIEVYGHENEIFAYKRGPDVKITDKLQHLSGDIIQSLNAEIVVEFEIDPELNVPVLELAYLNVTFSSADMCFHLERGFQEFIFDEYFTGTDPEYLTLE